MRGIAIFVALAAVIAATTQGAGAQSRIAGSSQIPVIRVGDLVIYSTLDPQPTQGCNANYCGLFMEHLLRAEPGGKVVPWLATSVTTPSPTTYVYHLRHGVKFWDGNEMTSTDVVNSINYQRAPKAPTAVFFPTVKSVTAKDRYTVVVHLTKPDADWQYTLSYEGVIFEKSFQDAHKTTMGKPGVLIQGTGPWKIDSFDPTSSIELSANPNWWGGHVPVAHISYKFFKDETSEALAMRAGEIDFAWPTDGRAFAKTSGVKLSTFPALDVAYFGMRTDMAPWNDIHVRRAVAYAIDRKEIVAAYGGSTTATPTTLFIPPVQLQALASKARVNALIRSLPQYAHSVAKAKQELAMSKYPNGFTAKSDVAAGSSTNVIEVVAAELAKIGITLKINVVQIAQFYNDYHDPKNGNLLADLGAVSPDASIFPSYGLDSKAAYNFAKYKSPQMDKLLATARAITAPARRFQLYSQVERLVATDVPYVPLYIPNSFTAVSPKYRLPPFFTYPAFVPWALAVKRAK